MKERYSTITPYMEDYLNANVYSTGVVKNYYSNIILASKSR